MLWVGLHLSQGVLNPSILVTFLLCDLTNEMSTEKAWFWSTVWAYSPQWQGHTAADHTESAVTKQTERTQVLSSCSPVYLVKSPSLWDCAACVGLLTSVKPLWQRHHRQAQKYSSCVILGPARLTMLTTTHRLCECAIFGTRFCEGDQVQTRPKENLMCPYKQGGEGGGHWTQSWLGAGAQLKRHIVETRGAPPLLSMQGKISGNHWFWERSNYLFLKLFYHFLVRGPSVATMRLCSCSPHRPQTPSLSSPPHLLFLKDDFCSL